MADALPKIDIFSVFIRHHKETPMKPRQLPSGRWELGVRHPSLPKGRKHFTFDTEAEALKYAEGWALMKQANLAPPKQLVAAEDTRAPVSLRRLLSDWEHSGHSAPSQKSAITRLLDEVGHVRLQDADIKWLEAYLHELKIKRRIKPRTIRDRVLCLRQAIDHYLRLNQHIKLVNVVRLLPRRYAIYGQVEQKLLEAAGKDVPRDQERDRRLHPGEEPRIVAALRGEDLDGVPNRLPGATGPDMHALFVTILHTGLRLLEAYRLRRSQVDFERRVIRAQSSKLWDGKVAYRDVPMDPELYEELKKYLSSRGTALPAAYLFPFLEEEGGLTFTQATNRLSLRFGRVFTYAGCPDLHEHDLRHEATCRWFERRNADGSWMFRPEEIRKIMGWSINSNMPARYASFRPEDLSSRLWAAQDNGQRGGRAAA
jgi:integrase